MTIASEIQRIQEGIKDVYNIAETKGATLPATKNSANLATCIDSISQGGIYDELASYQVIDGILQKTSKVLNGTEFDDIIDVDDEAFSNAFYECTNLTGKFSLPNVITINSDSAFSSAFYATGLDEVDLSAITSIDGIEPFYYAFGNCSSLTSVNLSSLITVSGNSGLSNAFSSCTSLTSVDLSSLTTVSGSNGFSNAFYSCTNLTNVSFPNLTTVSGSNGFARAFGSCRNLTDIYFNALTTSSFGTLTNQFSNMLITTSTSKTHILHFPSNMQSTIAGLSGYPLFGGTSGYVVLVFDLPATS